MSSSKALSKSGGSVPIHLELMKLTLDVPAIDSMLGKAVIGQQDSGLPLTRKSFVKIFDVWLPRYGLEIHAHQLRHTFATQLLYNGANIKQIQELLSHKRLDTTQRYLRLDESHRRAATRSVGHVARVPTPPHAACRSLNRWRRKL